MAMATHIPVRAWLEEEDDVLATVLDVYEQRARQARRG